MEKNQKNGNLLIGIIVLVALIAAVAVLGIIFTKPAPEVIQGQAEATDYRVSGKVPGRIETFYAKQGDMVHKGVITVRCRQRLLLFRAALMSPFRICPCAASHRLQLSETLSYTYYSQSTVYPLMLTN